MKKIFSFAYLAILLSAFLIPAAANAGACKCTGVQTGYSCDNDKQCENTAICPSNPDTATCDTSATPAPGSGSGAGTTPTPTTTTSLTNPLAGICKDAQGTACVQLVLGSVIKTALGVVGSIALLMAVWGGFLWLTSMGNESKVEQGKKTLIWSILGLVLIFGAYALTTFVFSAIAPGK